ncbi:MAG: insulinase family protein [Lachnospiraceae bacterium]|nr:insulinase family protein [Lachnospiraceae bacterium]
MKRHVTRAENHLTIPEPYELIDRRVLPDCDSVGYLLEHKKSGARVVLMDNTDDNKTFYIAFRTPPKDSTGVAHIMEHSVLCGSENFPLKDPFVELGKGSLNTFLNAMTYPDKTVYPVASCNDVDFGNLMHVYMDAVLHPSIYANEQIFRQEGWHYELDGEAENLSINGVVYNEMKGVFSSPDGVLDYAVMNSLFPDTSYGFESGGDPEVIPELTYEAFLKFHKTYYHPSNAYIYLYGDMDFTERLKWMDEEYLSGYDRIKVDSKIREQKPFTRMHRADVPYAIPSGMKPQDQAYLSWSKVIGTVLNDELYRAFQVLDYVLLSSTGAPLKRALIEAGIGQDVTGGYDCGIYQPMFTVTARRAPEDARDRFQQIIEETLHRQVTDGIDQKALEVAINIMRFSYIEGDSGRAPRGLIWGLALLDSWLYDNDKPFLHANAVSVFNRLKERIGTQYFENLVRTYLLENEHGSLITLRGEAGRAERLEEAKRIQLQNKKTELNQLEINEILEDGRKLRDYQDTEDTPEMLARIPVLALSDIKRESEPLLIEKMNCDVPFILHETGTNGIGYVRLLFDTSVLEEDELVAASILTRSILGQMDTDQYTYEEFGHEVDRITGGLTSTMTAYGDLSRAWSEIIRPMSEVQLKGFYDQLTAGFDLIEEMLIHTHLDDEKRLKEILAEIVSVMQTRILTDGHTLAADRSMAYQSLGKNYRDLISGIAYYKKVSDLFEHFDEKKDELIAQLQSVRSKIFTSANMMVSYTAEREGIGSVREMAEGLARALDQAGVPAKKRVFGPGKLTAPKGNEGFMTAGQVQYVARSGNFVKSGYHFTGVMDVLSSYLRWEYLWQNVRVKGGAYGCMTGFQRSGNAFFVSYRDPHLQRTWDVFEELPVKLRYLELSERELRQYIIGAINMIDQPLTPRSRGARSLTLYLSGVTKEMLDEEREQILETTQEDLNELADVVEDVLRQGYACTIGSEAKVREHENLFDEIVALQ